VGTYPVHRDELLQDLLDEERKLGYGFRPLSWKEIADLSQIWRKGGEKIVFTNGCFDILHVGHVSYLEKAAKLGKHLVVGLNSDDSVRRLKGEIRPLVHELDRARVLASLACVDAVVIFHEDTPARLIKMIRPDILVKGGDYRPDQVVGREYAGKVEIIEFEEGYSTTGLVNQIAGLVREGKL
jgi:D-beta-D-heptose 7-phosphate kinase/D-beta-D-heptose 1-phosphate adenosyltransferase